MADDERAKRAKRRQLGKRRPDPVERAAEERPRKRRVGINEELALDTQESEPHGPPPGILDSAMSEAVVEQPESPWLDQDTQDTQYSEQSDPIEQPAHSEPVPASPGVAENPSSPLPEEPVTEGTQELPDEEELPNFNIAPPRRTLPRASTAPESIFTSSDEGSSEDEEYEEEEEDEEELPNFNIMPNETSLFREDLDVSTAKDNPRLEAALREGYTTLVKTLSTDLPALHVQLERMTSFVGDLPMDPSKGVFTNNAKAGIDRLRLMVKHLVGKPAEQFEDRYAVLIYALTGKVEQRYYEFGFPEIDRKLRSLFTYAWNVVAREVIHNRLIILGMYDYCKHLVAQLRKFVLDTFGSLDGYEETLNRFGRGLTRYSRDYLPNEQSVSILPEDFKELVSAGYSLRERVLVVGGLYEQIRSRWTRKFPEFDFPEIEYDYRLPTGSLEQNADSYSLKMKGWFLYQSDSPSSRNSDLREKRIPVESVTVLQLNVDADFYPDIIRKMYPRFVTYSKIIHRMTTEIEKYKKPFEYMVSIGMNNRFFRESEYQAINLLPYDLVDHDPALYETRPLTQREILEYINAWHPLPNEESIEYPREDEWGIISTDAEDRMVQNFTPETAIRVRTEIPFIDYTLAMILRQSVTAAEVSEAVKLPYVKSYSRRELRGDAGSLTTRYVLLIDMKKAHKTAFMNLVRDNGDKTMLLREQQWFFTVNSNMNTSRLAEEARMSESGFKNRCRETIGSFMPAFVSNYTMEYIVGWEIQFDEAEIGPSHGKVHYHALVKVVYVSTVADDDDSELPRLLLDYVYFRSMFLAKFPSCYVNVVPVKVPLNSEDDDYEQRISAYIAKGRESALVRERGSTYVGVQNPGTSRVTGRRGGRRAR